MPGSDPSRLVIDVSRVTACDAMGLGALFGAHLRAACYGGQLHLVCPEGPLLHVLDVTACGRPYRYTRPWLRRCPLPSRRRPGRRAR
ncbi:STAS domain-containing protein [Streptomyces sp. NPDC002078]